jgi:predicted Zn finger-like uncharacterized protein
MSIHITCPSCSTAYTLDDENAGKKALCKKCGEKFRVPAAGDMPEALPVSTSESSGPSASGELRRKRQRFKDRTTPGIGRRQIIWIASGALAFIVLALALVFWIRGGPRGPDLVGKWKGAPEVREAVKQATAQATKGQPVNPLALGFAQALIQKGAEQLLAVEIDFRQGGTAFYSGNTGIVGMPEASDGPWQIVKADNDVLIVRMGTPGKSFEARLAFRDRDTFTLTRPDQPNLDPVTFTRE